MDMCNPNADPRASLLVATFSTGYKHLLLQGHYFLLLSVSSGCKEMIIQNWGSFICRSFGAAKRMNVFTVCRVICPRRNWKYICGVAVAGNRAYKE